MKKIILITAICAICTQANSQWQLTGNAGTNASTNFIGTTDNVPFKIRTNNAVRMTINPAGKVGIGTTSPQNKLHVNGTGNLARFGTGTTAATYNYWFTGNDVGSYIEQRGNTTTAGSDKFRIQSSKSGNNAEYSQFIIDPNNGFSFLGNGTSNGNVKIDNGILNIGYNFPTTSKLVVYNGTTIGSYNTTGWLHSSDERLKTNIQPLESSLDKIVKLQGVSYNWKQTPGTDNQIGFIAQEVEKIFPEVIVKNPEGNYAMAPQNLTAPIVEAIKEQQKQIESKDVAIKSLQSTVGGLQNENTELKSRLDKLENVLSQCSTNYQPSKDNQQSTAGNQQTNAAKLEQNLPNPFSHQTEINYQLPSQFNSAQIIISDAGGKQVRSYSLKPLASLIIKAGELAAGTYTYALLIDGIISDSRQLILTR